MLFKVKKMIKTLKKLSQSKGLALTFLTCVTLLSGCATFGLKTPEPVTVGQVMKMTMFQPCERRVDGKPASYLLLAIILLVIMMSTVAEADCWKDSLKQVNRDTLVMDSEAVYQVVPRDEMRSIFWLPPLISPFAIRLLTLAAP